MFKPTVSSIKDSWGQGYDKGMMHGKRALHNVRPIQRRNTMYMHGMKTGIKDRKQQKKMDKLLKARGIL